MLPDAGQRPDAPRSRIYEASFELSSASQTSQDGRRLELSRGSQLRTVLQEDPLAVKTPARTAPIGVWVADLDTVVATRRLVSFTWAGRAQVDHGSLRRTPPIALIRTTPNWGSTCRSICTCPWCAWPPASSSKFGNPPRNPCVTA